MRATLTTIAPQKCDEGVGKYRNDVGRLFSVISTFTIQTCFMLLLFIHLAITNETILIH